jgi:hypothetical protein
MNFNHQKINLIVFFINIYNDDISIFSAKLRYCKYGQWKREVSIRNVRNDFKIEYEGEILLSDDGTDIKNISSGGFLKIKKSSFGRNHKNVIEKEENTLVRKF